MHPHRREAVIGALSSLPQHGFDQLDRTLIVHAALVSGAYVAFHRKWLRAVQVGGAGGCAGVWQALSSRHCAAGTRMCGSFVLCILSATDVSSISSSTPWLPEAPWALLPALQGNPLAAELAAADAAGQLPRELYNHYTIIVKASRAG